MIATLGIRRSLRRTIVMLSVTSLVADPKVTARLLIRRPLSSGTHVLLRTPNNADPLVLPLFTKVRIRFGRVMKSTLLSVPILGKAPLTLPKCKSLSTPLRRLRCRARVRTIILLYRLGSFAVRVVDETNWFLAL